MCENQCHASALAQETCFFDPDRLVAVTEQIEERVVLRERDRQLDEVLDHERKPRAAAAGLGLERSSVGVRRVVVEAEQRHQLGRAQCGGRPKSFRLPALGRIANPREPAL
jgi:hypothetical protein